MINLHNVKEDIIFNKYLHISRHLFEIFPIDRYCIIYQSEKYHAKYIIYGIEVY